ncbi:MULTISPECIES: hypothetical protein [unclassified Agrobacterium]|uniref:hypothetical protein n=1 Tax=unclassified Agrobacterium TaxID=2632611 RepID=UPI00244CC686|nr:MULTISPECIES: hypothetical protein [unclassified Agrobacterium]MDH0615922.1 hypothetical protein [Agrobacterium sp. GD03872]MDH0698037.1 hypothetical protein [Agrobacterium sp. GD03871]MDH1061122.1 hypothetical protein [Agrobacterium sp. GD03992]MDH2211846.1 hypothetical protein [Agrobacterium sp. GD03643]MDH2221238.1 hypothetical protein [Agrobacterium sp. GD03638]
MVSLFERLAKTSRSTVERVHGVDVTVFPISNHDPNAGIKLDGSNPPYPTVACFFENTEFKGEQRAQPSADGRKILHRAPQRQASIRLIDGKPFKTDFYLRRESDQKLFTITQFDPDGSGNVMALLAVAASLPT